MVSQKIKKRNELTVGNNLLFAMVHFALIMFFVTLAWIIVNPIIEDAHLILKSFFTILYGLAGVGLYMLTVPTLRRVEQEYIILENEKKNKKPTKERKTRRVA